MKSGLLAQPDLERYFSAISTAQETVDRFTSIVGMQDNCRDNTLTISFAN